MASIRDDAICVRHWDFSETSQTVSLLLREHGLLRGLAKGARREKGAFSGGIELLTRGQVVGIVKSSTALATLTSWDLCETFPAVRGSYEAYGAAMYMADLTGQLLRDGDPHPGVYDALLKALRGLGQAVGRELLAFQWSLLAECGYAPELTNDVRTSTPLERASTYGFAPSLGGLVADEGDGAWWRVRANTIDVLRGVDSTGEASGSDEAVDRANRLLASYVREILGKEPPSMGVVFETPRVN